jgi:tetratricopeptide (TPR) repeat protein
MDKQKMTHDKLMQNFHLLQSNPSEYLRMANELVSQDPTDPHAYFSRHQAWVRLGKPERGLADLDKSLSLQKHYVTFRARGTALRQMGNYRAAINDYNTSEAMDPEAWKGGFGPFLRGDCYARLGDVESALADCAALPEEHWTPGLLGLPAGTKADVIVEIKRIAALARQRNQQAKSHAPLRIVPRTSDG